MKSNRIIMLAIMSVLISGLVSCTSSKNDNLSSDMKMNYNGKEYKLVKDKNTRLLKMIPDDGIYKIYSDEGKDLFVRIANGSIDGVYKNNVSENNKTDIVIFFHPCNEEGLEESYDLLELFHKKYRYRGNSTCRNTQDNKEVFYVTMMTKSKKDCWYTLD